MQDSGEIQDLSSPPEAEKNQAFALGNWIFRVKTRFCIGLLRNSLLSFSSVATRRPPRAEMQHLKFAPIPHGRQHYSVLQKGASQNYFEIAAGLYVPRLAQIRALLNFATAPSPTSGFRLKSWHSETKCGSKSPLFQQCASLDCPKFSSIIIHKLIFH